MSFFMPLILLIASFQDATINAVVTTEVLCWFFIGECIGKRSLIGYQV
jgi:F-type H+-transporting ATPase subunit g